MFCITSALDDVRTCTTKGIHLRNCRDDDCQGCQPQEAIYGFLCERCYLRLEHAYAMWDNYVHTVNPTGRLADTITTIRRDNAGIRSHQDGYINLTALALSIEEAESHLRTSGGEATLVSWVNTQGGAADAVRFTRVAEATYRSHPIADTARPIRRVRCPRCHQLTMTRKPPTEPVRLLPQALGPLTEQETKHGLVTIECQNPACRSTFHEAGLAGTELVDTIAGMEAAS